MRCYSTEIIVQLAVVRANNKQLFCDLRDVILVKYATNKPSQGNYFKVKIRGLNKLNVLQKQILFNYVNDYMIMNNYEFHVDLSSACLVGSYIKFRKWTLEV